jgi:hypothetical protein
MVTVTSRPSLLEDLEVEHKRLFFDQEIIVIIVITSPLIIFPSEALYRIDIVPKGQHLKVGEVPFDTMEK